MHRSRFLGDTSVPRPEFQGGGGGAFAKSGGQTKSIRFLPVKLKTVFGKFLFYSILSSMSIVWAREGVQMTVKKFAVV